MTKTPISSTSSKIWLGVIVFGLIAGFSSPWLILHIYDRFYEPNAFQAWKNRTAIMEFVNRELAIYKKSQARGWNIDGKVIVVEGDLFGPAHLVVGSRDVPDELIATEPSEIGTIVVFYKSFIATGYYRKGSSRQAETTSVEYVRVISLVEGRIVFDGDPHELPQLIARVKPAVLPVHQREPAFDPEPLRR